jgi:hypothetical protein
VKPLLTLALLLLAATAQAQEQTPTQPGDKLYAAFPTGEGDPNQMTCRPPQRVTSSRLMGPEVCKRNYEWARYRRDGMDVAADGRHDVKLKSGAENTCRGTSTAGASTGATLGIRCD